VGAKDPGKVLRRIFAMPLALQTPSYRGNSDSAYLVDEKSPVNHFQMQFLKVQGIYAGFEGKRRARLEFLSLQNTYVC
jgi:hypothetical protein